MLWMRVMENKRDLLAREETECWNSRLSSGKGHPGKLWRSLNKLLAKDSQTSSETISAVTADALSDYFVKKVADIRETSATSSPPTYPVRTDEKLSEFRECTMEEVRRVICDAHAKSCSLDPIPTTILREFLEDLLPFVWLMCSRSLTQAHLPSTQKAAIVTPILKKAGLDSTELKNYRPISNLSFLS